ncbi:unnamed protein product [Owenia fusiformis]|uniref:Uncharacterized protein n=1 Tax=Owenia fusiformis TaxID=6347 RepID=A0A8S4P1W0_OWEFU|nr:unnamed protein product [Owenia fusiformis]
MKNITTCHLLQTPTANYKTPTAKCHKHLCFTIREPTYRNCKMNKICASTFMVLVVSYLVSAESINSDSIELNAAESSEEIENDFEAKWGVDNENVKNCDDCKEYGWDTTYLNAEYREEKHKFYAEECFKKFC